MSQSAPVGYFARWLAVSALRPAPGYRFAPCPPAPPPPRFGLDVRINRVWVRRASASCRLDLAVFARVSFPGRRFRLSRAE